MRDFYEIESVRNGWSARQLERQMNSFLFERLAKSRDKKGVLALANEGQALTRPQDVIKDPYVLEFLDLPESHRLVESRIEEALINQLQAFLLELGSGFAFVGRQRRLTLDGDHFYPDLVFYHVKLKCYVVIDLKVGKLSSKSGAEEEEMVRKLLAVESVDEPTEIVIHVNMLKEGWDVTNLYPLQKFDSDTERRFAVILERDAEKWFKPAKGQFQMFYKLGVEQPEYVPDFVAETAQFLLMCETKARNELGADDVKAKAEAGALWCQHASDHAKTTGAKPWKYLLIAHDQVTEDKSIADYLHFQQAVMQ